MKLTDLPVWRDSVFRSPAFNMALDEALFAWTLRSGSPVARLYAWDRPAMTAGYFQLCRPDRAGSATHTPTRRFTGGGLVEHGEDLTFLLTFPAGTEAARIGGMERYRWIHTALADALLEVEIPVVLQAQGPSPSPGPCFATPVPWDLLDANTGRKIGGGAQRRSRGAVIHQGSVRVPPSLRDPSSLWVGKFLSHLAEERPILEESVRKTALEEAQVLEETRYASGLWNHRS